jgi:hypothetical protein
MRWTDLPPDRDPADAGASALAKAQWEDLKGRLERLPPGHPSRPDEAGEAGEARLAGDEAADQDVPDGNDPAGAVSVRDDDHGGGRAPGGRHRPETDGSGAHDAARSVPGGPREPYRPWFTAGEPPEPWFTADPAE